MEQPVEADGRVVTFWESISRDEVYAPIYDVGVLIKRLHHMVAPPGLDLPELRPFGAPDDELPRLAGLPADDAEFLCATYLRHRADSNPSPAANAFLAMRHPSSTFPLSRCASARTIATKKSLRR